ncbi:MAG: hypothetical protein ACRERU_12560 [Methylococcales bacterium]
MLNKATTPKAAPKQPGDEYVAETLYDRLRGCTDPILSPAIDLEGLKLLRSHLNVAFKNDGDAAASASFPPYTTFSCDYSTPSLDYLGNRSKNHGNAGAFVWLVLNETESGRRFLELVGTIAAQASAPLAVVGKPFVVGEEIDYPEKIAELCGDPPLSRIAAVSSLMELQTASLLRLAQNILARSSSYDLRKLIIGLGSWLLGYQIRRIPGAAESIFFSDFAGESHPRIRTQASTCYARQIGLFGRSVQLWLNTNQDTAVDQESRRVLESLDAKGKVSKEMEAHFRDFSERIGWVQPRGTVQKFFRAVPDTMRVLLLSILEQGEIITIDEVAERLRAHWRLVLGLLPGDHATLRRNGYSPLDEDTDLRANREVFKQLAIHLGFAWEPSDGLVLFSLTPDQMA